MKFAVSAEKAEMAARVEQRFGRAQWFVIVDDRTGQWEELYNVVNASAQQGAGIATARALTERNVEAVVTGHVGPKAAEALSAAGIEVCTFTGGLVSDAIAAFKNGRLKPVRSRSAAAGGDD